MCTIIAKNYLAFARTLCQSFLDHHPAGKCFVLVIDDITGYVNQANEVFEIVHIESIGIPDVRQMCFKYNVTELATAAKPFLLNYLICSQSIGKLVYLDPDILVLGSLTPLYDELDTCDILLTPHLDTDFSEDGLRPDDSHIMKSGIYNLGFIGVRACKNVQNFLDWWQAKLAKKCVIDHAKGYFVDQKFIDLALCLFSGFKVFDAVTANVAYWNLHSRHISFSNEHWLVNDLTPLFFHFSGFNPLEPSVISKHQNRHSLSELPALAALFSHYRNLLFDNEFEKCMNWKYQHGFFSNGKKVSDSERAVFRNSDIQAVELNPFTYNSHSRLFRIKVVRLRLGVLLKKWFSQWLQ